MGTQNPVRENLAIAHSYQPFDAHDQRNESCSPVHELHQKPDQGASFRTSGGGGFGYEVGNVFFVNRVRNGLLQRKKGGFLGNSETK